MACESCPFQNALNLANEVLAANPGNAFDPSAFDRKTRQFAISTAVVDKAAPDCKGLKQDDGKDPECGVASTINNVVSLLLGKPAMELEGQNGQSQMGFRTN